MNLTLPWPPSLNRYYRSLRRGALAGRVLISEEGRAYRTAVDAVVRDARGGKCYDVPLSVSIAAFPPDRRARDLDNILKGVLDSLQHSGVYLNDSQIDRLLVERRPVVKFGKLDVTIEPLLATAPAVEWVLNIDSGWRKALGDALEGTA